MSKPDLAPPPSPSPSQRWTRVDEYLGALARRRTARRSREPQRLRTEPESPRLLLSTLPFAVLIAVLAVLIIAFAIAAWPPSQPHSDPPRTAERHQGTAPPGWLDEAKKEMR